MYKRIAYAVEASKIWELHADQVKRITGGDSVPYRNLYAQSVERIPRFTPLIVTNEMPRIKGSDQALKRRMIVFMFDKTLPPELEDTRIKDRFINDEGCLRALLARIVLGAQDPLMRDGIKWTMMPEKYAVSTMESFGQLDHVDEFVSWLKDRDILKVVNMTETAVSHCARANELHEWYTLWIKKHGDKQDKAEALNMKDFGAALRERGWVSKLSAGTRWVGVQLSQSPGILSNL
jgi:putative DNA primase/helicase